MSKTMLPALLFFLALFPGQSGQSQEDQGFRIGVAVNQVFLSVNARSVAGGFVRGLEAEDFQVFEDGVSQEIVNFYSEGVPVQVALLVDISGSTRESQGAIRYAASRFASSLGPEDKVSIITFNDKPRLILDWTDDKGAVATALLSTYAKGMTVLNDALYVTYDDLLKGVEGKTAIIALTDGVDTESMTSQDDVLELAERSDTMVYVVSKLEEYWAGAIAARLRLQAASRPVPWQLSDESIMTTRAFLARLAHRTGGEVLNADAFNTLGDVYEQVAEELKNQYYISYVPTNIIKDGGWRQVLVRVRKPGVAVSTRPGYYAPSETDGTP